MGNTLDALTASTTTSVTLQTVVAVEGLPYLLTDGEASAAVTAWAATEWTQAISGLRVKWNVSQRLDPWGPFSSSDSSVTLEIDDATDVFPLMFFKREGHTSTTLDEDLTAASTAGVAVRDSSAFAASGVIHIGSEAIAYDTNSADEFTDVTRGYYSPFRYEGGGGFGRAHIAAANIEGFDADATSSTAVSDAPLDFRGRWVGVWLHRVVDGVLDVKAEAHLAFAGKIANYTDSANGALMIECTEVRDTIREAVILRNQWRATMRSGIYLGPGINFRCTDRRTYTVAGNVVHDVDDATALRVLNGVVTAPYEIAPGFYSGGELETKIGAWLEAARANAELLFTHAFQYTAQTPAGETRSALGISDPTVGNDGARSSHLRCTDARVHAFFGWDPAAGLTAEATTRDFATTYSATEPLRVMLPSGVSDKLRLEKVRGEFFDQSAFMAPFFSARGYVAFVQIGDAILPCSTLPTGTGDDVELDVFGPINLRIGAGETAYPNLNLNAEGVIEVAQVLILEGTFKKLALGMFCSTGSGNNWPTYDVMPSHVSAEIPYDLLGSGFEAEIGAAPNADHPMTVIVEKPTRLSDLWNASFMLRGLHLMWRQGRLTLKAYATPTSSATLTLGSDDRAAPVGDGDSMRAVTQESDRNLRNVISVKHNGNPFTGTYRDTTVLRDIGSAGNFGAAPYTITARNAAGGAELAGEDIAALLPRFASQLTFVTRPQTLVNVPVPFTLFETLTPGETCLFSDPFARDPQTGLRGISGRPALIVESRYYGWGGEDPAVGEVRLQLFPRLSLAQYAPCAQVASYNAGTNTLTCETHEQSEAADAVDASHFAAGDKVRVVQMDPDDAAAPLSWDGEVASRTGNDIVLLAGLTGFDAALKYRIYSDDYTDAVTAQRTKAYQADDADGLIADLRAPYGLASFGAGQVATFTPSTPATELAERPPDASFGDGVALDTGHARAQARGVNALVSYLTAPQHPEVVETMSYGGTGTRTLVYAAPIFIGVGQAQAGWTRRLYVAPTISKGGGPSSTIRITVSPRMPRSADPSAIGRTDVEFIAPYVQTSFATTSPVRETPTAVALNIDHVNLAEGPLGGWAWVLVEVEQYGSFYGFGQLYVGPMVSV